MNSFEDVGLTDEDEEHMLLELFSGELLPLPAASTDFLVNEAFQVTANSSCREELVGILRIGDSVVTANIDGMNSEVTEIAACSQSLESKSSPAGSVRRNSTTKTVSLNPVISAGTSAVNVNLIPNLSYGSRVNSLQTPTLDRGPNCSSRARSISPSISRATHGIRPRDLTLEHIKAYFSMPLVDAARALGMSVTMLKKSCRKHGIRRWPHRKIASIDRMIEQLKEALDNVEISQVDLSKDPTLVQDLQRRLSELKVLKTGIMCSMNFNSENIRSYVSRSLSDDGYDDDGNSTLRNFYISVERDKNQELIRRVVNVKGNSSSFSYGTIVRHTEPATLASLARQPSYEERYNLLKNSMNAASPLEQLLLQHQQSMRLINSRNSALASMDRNEAGNEERQWES